MARRAGGGETTPVLVAPEGVFAESEDILVYADESLPEELRLFPTDRAHRREVEGLCRWLDAGLGPEGRRLMYAHMFRHRKLMLEVNCQGVPAWERRMMTALWPMMVQLVKRVLAVGPETIREDEPRVLHALDTVADQLSDGRRYLTGDRFTAADLTFAALSAAVLVPPEYGVALPQPERLPQPLADKIRSFRKHSAGEFGLRLFREERHRQAVAGSEQFARSARAPEVA
jgi:glutathione S-transferase